MKIPYEEYLREVNAKNEAYLFILACRKEEDFRRFLRARAEEADPHKLCREILMRRAELEKPECSTKAVDSPKTFRKTTE